MKEPAFKQQRYFVLDQADEFMDYLRNGWHFDVLCRADAHQRNAYWYGEWVVILVSPEGDTEIPLIKARRGGQYAEDMRLFKTINGLYTFCMQYGVRSPHIPSRQGGRERQTVTLEDFNN